MRSFLGGTGLKDGETAYLSDDSLNGWFKWDASSVVNDDGVNIIKITTVLNGRFLRLVEQSVVDLQSQILTATHLATEYAATKTANYSIDPDNGYVQVITDNTGSLQLSVTDNFSSNKLRSVCVIKGTGVPTMTFTGITWAGIGAGSVAPDLTGLTEIHFELFKIGGTIYGYAFGEV